MAALNGREKAREKIEGLVGEFHKGLDLFKDPRKYDEAKVRAGFIDPFFEALGWPVKEAQRRFGRHREVVVEDRAGRGNRRRPDYGFYSSGELKFYVEAKAPSHDLSADLDATYQLKSYVWSKRAPLGILCDFEELFTFHGAYKPRREKPTLGQVPRLTMTYEQYPAKFDLLYDTFSRDAVVAGAIERLLAEELAASVRQRGQLERDLFKARGAVAVDADFLANLTRWREEVAKELARRNEFRSGEDLTEAVQRFLDRLVFARIAEDRGLERSETLTRAVERWQREEGKRPLYAHLIELFRRLAVSFNGGLFGPHPLSDDAVFTDDKLLHSVIKDLYFPECSYRFDAMSVELLGGVYEQFLGSVVRVTEGGKRAKVEEKPEVRHAGGVFYTPRYVVDTIVDRTLGPLLEGSTPEKALQLHVLDPACGSGSFLLGAFQYLMDWHLRYYAEVEAQTKKYRTASYVDEDGNRRLTLQRKREILTNCIYGVDIDAQAVEVAQMSLYLKLMEDEAEESIAFQRSLEMFKADRYLPNLSKNIRQGNSLLDPQHLDPQLDWTDQDMTRINPFDWQSPSSGFGDIVAPPDDGERGGFDAVIGNPPYIRVQALTQWAPIEVELYKKIYATAREGNYDIYVVFIERSLQLLRSGGRLGFIVPNKWWQATYGSALRGLVRGGRHYREIIDFGFEQVFEDPTTYTCISLFSKTPSESVSYERMSPPELRAKGDHAKPVWAHSLTAESLDDGPWYPGVPKLVRSLFDRLRHAGPFLGDPEICPRVFQGLKTSLDPVYVLDVVADEGKHLRVRSKALDEELVLERGLLKPLAKGREMKRFAPLPPRKVVLFPYDPSDGKAKLISPTEFQTKYPRAWKYLLANKDALDGRERGRFKGKGWYQYGRTQALDVVALPKILTADLADRMAFSLDGSGGTYLLGGAAGGYGLLPATPEFAAPLLALLNSTLLEWMLRPPGLSSPFRGGWFSCEARFINLLPIRLPGAAKERATLGGLAEKAVELYGRQWSARSDRDRSLVSRQIEAVEAQIDDLVFKLYDVKADERREVVRLVAEARTVAAPAEGDDADPSANGAEGD